jgi:hypothetical protein
LSCQGSNHGHGSHWPPRSCATTVYQSNSRQEQWALPV